MAKEVAALKTNTEPNLVIGQDPSALPLLAESGKIVDPSAALKPETAALYPGIKSGFVAVTMVLGLAIALLLDVRLPGLAQVRAFFVIPLVVPPVATAFIWFTFFQPGTGLFNRLLDAAGLPQVTLSNPTDAMIAVIAFGAWQYFGEFVLIYLAALKTLPRDVLEAASVDGAGAWQRLRFIRWPLLRHQTALLTIIATLYGLQTFTQIYVLTDGGPQGATQTALYYVYRKRSASTRAARSGWPTRCR
jgi:multiple sugar transport system permease protein